MTKYLFILTLPFLCQFAQAFECPSKIEVRIDKIFLNGDFGADQVFGSGRLFSQKEQKELTLGSVFSKKFLLRSDGENFCSYSTDKRFKKSSTLDLIKTSEDSIEILIGQKRRWDSKYSGKYSTWKLEVSGNHHSLSELAAGLYVDYSLYTEDFYDGCGFVECNDEELTEDTHETFAVGFLKFK